MQVLGKDMDTMIMTTGEIAASGSFTTDAYIARGIEGDATLQWTVTGDGTMKAEVLTSNDGTVFNDIVTDIITGQTETSGIGGTNMVSFGIPPCAFVKFKFSETGGANHIHVTAYLRVN